jgi:hypothetical protein
MVDMIPHVLFWYISISFVVMMVIREIIILIHVFPNSLQAMQAVQHVEGGEEVFFRVWLVWSCGHRVGFEMWHQGIFVEPCDFCVSQWFDAGFDQVIPCLIDAVVGRSGERPTHFVPSWGVEECVFEVLDGAREATALGCDVGRQIRYNKIYQLTVLLELKVYNERTQISQMPQVFLPPWPVVRALNK